MYELAKLPHICNARAGLPTLYHNRTIGNLVRLADYQIEGTVYGLARAGGEDTRCCGAAHGGERRRRSKNFTQHHSTHIPLIPPVCLLRRGFVRLNKSLTLQAKISSSDQGVLMTPVLGPYREQEVPAGDHSDRVALARRRQAATRIPTTTAP